MLKNSKMKSVLSLLLAFAMVIGFAPVPAKAAEDEAITNNIVLQKLQYKNVVTEVKNTGDKVDDLTSSFGTEVEAYNKSIYGEVEFSVYKVEDTEEKPFGDAEPQEIADAIEAEVLAETAQANPKYDYSQIGIAEAVDASGQVTFSGLTEGHYVIVETKKPATVTAQAKPMFVSLPITNAEGTGFKKGDIYLYPKNKVRDNKIEIFKYSKGVAKDATEAALEGATFRLYQGEVGAGKEYIIDGGLISAVDGKIELGVLPIGKYYLVEESSGSTTYLVGKHLQNNADNRYFFELANDGTIKYGPESLLSETNLKVINHEKPSLTKDIKDVAEEAIPSYSEGDLIPYIINVNVPNDIANYDLFKITDTPATGMEVVMDSVVVSIVDASGTEVAKLTKDTDYTIIPSGVGFEINPIIDSTVNKANLAGNVIKIEYNGKILADAVSNTELENTAKLDWDNGSGLETGKGTEEDKEKVKTYGKKFIKKDAGLWGTGVLGDGGLADAHFVLEKEVTDEEFKTSWEVVAGYEDIVSSADGTFSVDRLAEGKYRLREIQAPTGFRLPTGLAVVAEFELNDASIANNDTAEVIKNTKETDLPVTGLDAAGYSVVALAGLGLVAVLKKRKDNKAE